MSDDLQQRLAASVLLEFVERLAREGHLPPADEAELRWLSVKCCRAFKIDTLAERPANSNCDLDYQLTAMAVELAKTDEVN